MWTILSVFFVGSGFIIERLSYFKKLKSNDVDLETISAATKKWGIDAVDRFEYTDGPLIKFFRTGRRANKNEPDIINVESSLDNSANVEIAAMEHNISWMRVGMEEIVFEQLPHGAHVKLLTCSSWINVVLFFPRSNSCGILNGQANVF